MKVLHTSDWHLGQKLYGRARDEEHRLALDWMLQLIDNQQVECLIVAGDIFDTANPPNSAETIYYDFLSKLLRIKTCRHVVIIGGNHDQPARLNAPRGLMRALGMHVVGCVTNDLMDELIFLKNDAGELELLVAAVPFLRPSDFKTVEMGEHADARIFRIKQNIYAHFTAIGDLCAPYFAQKIPIIGTGHLYASGASATEEQRNIYLGNLENIAADQFPNCFDYVALGHIHRPQKVGKSDKIRYSGSPIPLSFSEISDVKSVVLLEIKAGQNTVLQEVVPVPIFRRLIKISGKINEIESKIREIVGKMTPEELPVWLETTIELHGESGASFSEDIRQFCLDLPIENLRTRLENKEMQGKSIQNSENSQLSDLDPMTVFLQKIGNPIDQLELKNTFLELFESKFDHEKEP